jgi:HSP20 family protein
MIMANITPWRGRREVGRFRNEMDRLFDDFFARSPLGRSFDGSDWTPAVDMSESENQIVVNVEVPGIDGKNIDVSLNGRLLTIKGERKQEREEKEDNYHFVERKYGSFSRSFDLPADVEADKITANCKDGVLKVTLPKTKAQPVKKIEVKAS